MLLPKDFVRYKLTGAFAMDNADGAGTGAGVWDDVASACDTCVKITGSTQPETLHVDPYRKGYALFRELYPALKEVVDQF